MGRGAVKRYIVAGCQPWAETAYLQVLKSSEESWAFVRNTEELGAAVSASTGKERVRWIFFLHWNEIVPSILTNYFSCVNFHCTDLPYGRGGNPIENLILHGHASTVITAHRMTHEIDAGPIYGQSAAISLAGTKAEILQRFVEPCASLMRWIVETEPTPHPQVGEPTYFKRLSPQAYQAFWRARG